MKTRLASLLLLIVALPVMAGNAPWREGELLVKYRDAAGPAKTMVAGAVIRPAAAPGLRRVQLPAGMPVAEAAARYRHDPAVLYAEPNYIARKTVVPDDTRYTEQWALPLMQLPRAWEATTTGTDVIIAILDTGIDYGHPDLAANMWVNPGEVPDDGQDNDGNGYVDDIHGILLDGGRTSGDPMDDDTADSHGTHVAGIAAAVGNNNTGITGINWSARLMAVKVLHGPQGEGTALDIATGIRYAVDRGAAVINLSLGFIGYSQTLADAIAYADDKGVLVISAAGNDGIDLSGQTEMPATLRLPNNIAVAATTRYERLAGYSNYGRAVIDVAAPGGSYLTANGAILSTMSPIAGQGLYATAAGTSMAAPQVAGLAALVWAAFPGLDHHAVKARILNGVTALAELDDRIASGGRVDAYETLSLPDLPAIFDVTPATLPAGGTVTLRGLNFGATTGSVTLGDTLLTVVPRWDPDGRLIEVETPRCGVSGRLRVNGAGSGFPLQLQQQPTVSIAPPVGVAGAPYAVRLTAQASDPGGEVVQYEWDTDGGGYGAPQADSSIVVDFAMPGSYRVRVRVTDNCGYTASAERLVDLTVPPSSSADSRCFIATAAWGSSLHPRVRVLREFRDRYLMGNPLGRALVALYYRYSPPLADLIRRSPGLRAVAVSVLTPVVASAEWLLALSGQPGDADTSAPVPPPATTADFVAGELLLKFRAGVSQARRQALLAERQAEIIRHSASDLYYLRLPEDADTLRVIEWYAAQPEVEFAEPNYRVRKMKNP